MAAPDFWNNTDRANATVADLKRMRSVLEPYEALMRAVDDAVVMNELAAEDGSQSALDEVAKALGVAVELCEKLEFAMLLSGPHDQRNAYLTVQAGAGGTESCDWAQMLFRMYVRWAERKGFDLELIDENRHEEAGIKSSTVLVKGPYAYGFLRCEVGVHRLVRISPFDAAARRHTSFCSVDVAPEFDEDIAVEIRTEDLRVDTYRAGGAGGQHVNKTDSAIRLTHLPTGIVVQCQSERSQHKNRATAMKMLKAKLFQLEEEKREAELRGLAGDKSEIAWGRQIRSYVLQPYQLVKDVRTGTETGNAAGVLDGDVDPFIHAFLQAKARGTLSSGGAPDAGDDA
jgi:peptide chain release factor 2